MTQLRTILILLIVFLAAEAGAQEVKNIRVSQTGNRVDILYDLAGTGMVEKINLFYTVDDGRTWQGPLRNISGDVSSLQAPALDRRISWDGITERPGLTGEIQFKIVADIFQKTLAIQEKQPVAKTWKSDPVYRKHKTWSTVWLSSALASAGVGLVSKVRANQLYDQYKTAGTKVTDLRSQVETFDAITPVAFGLSGLCGIAFIVKSSAAGKVRKQLLLTPSADMGTGGIKLTYNF